MRLGLKQLGHDVLKRRYRFRQFIGGAFGMFVILTAEPVRPLLYAGIALVCLGAAIRLWAAGHVHKSKKLATTGPYSFVRHPQYLGNSLLAFGFCVASGHWWLIAVWFLIFWLFYLPAIEREDGKLRRRFGEAWADWAEKTPAVVPVRWPGFRLKANTGEWSFLLAIRNGELVWMICVVAALCFLM